MRNKTTTTADALRALSSLLCVGSFALSRRDRALAAACAGASLALAAVDLLLRFEGHDGDGDDAPRRPPRPRARARSSDYESDAGSVATARDEAPASSPPKQHVTELLVHNVSHTDLVVSFGGPDDGFDDLDDDAALFARPKFSHFAAVSAEECLHWVRECYPGPVESILFQFPTPYALQESRNAQLPTANAKFMCHPRVLRLAAVRVDTRGQSPSFEPVPSSRVGDRSTRVERTNERTRGRPFLVSRPEPLSNTSGG